MLQYPSMQRPSCNSSTLRQRRHDRRQIDGWRIFITSAAGERPDSIRGRHHVRHHFREHWTTKRDELSGFGNANIQKLSWQATQSREQSIDTRLDKEHRQFVVVEHRLHERQNNLVKISYRSKLLRHLSCDRRAHLYQSSRLHMKEIFRRQRRRVEHTSISRSRYC